VVNAICYEKPYSLDQNYYLGDIVMFQELKRYCSRLSFDGISNTNGASPIMECEQTR
jgi:hypothetical protein